MFNELMTPTFSTFWGVLGILLLILLTSVAAFPAFLAFYLRMPGWPVPATIMTAYAVSSLIFPHPTIRAYLNAAPSPPFDVIRLGLLVVGLTIGLYLVGAWVLNHMQGRKK